jgi:hypothetical protein
MNIFVLETDPKKAAQAHADKHIVKMILEACQMLYSAHWTAAFPFLLENRSPIAVSQAQKQLPIPPLLADAPQRGVQKKKSSNDNDRNKDRDSRGYRPVHLHHPCTRWVRASLENYNFTCELAAAIGEEYTHRYGAEHACSSHARWLLANPPSPSLPSLGLQPFAIAMKQEFKISDDPIICYRHYYRESKGERDLLTYTKRAVPEWLLGAKNIKLKNETK